MKITAHTFSRIIPALAALVPLAPAWGQEPASVAPAPPAAVQFEVQSSRTVQDGGRKITIQQVRPPDRSAVPRVVVPALTPEEIAIKRVHYQPSRIVWLTATTYPGGWNYLEWRGNSAEERFAAWSRADCRLFSAIGEFHLENDRTRYLVITTIRRAKEQNSLQPPTSPVPGDGPGFVLTKGDADNSGAINPIAAVHRISRTEADQLRLRLEERERKRMEDKAWQAAHPVAPRDVVIRFWPKKSGRRTAESSTPSANE